MAIRDRANGSGLTIRAGVRSGEVEIRGDDVAGVTVHEAARISAAAGGDEILVSETTRLLAAGHLSHSRIGVSSSSRDWVDGSCTPLGRSSSGIRKSSVVRDGRSAHATVGPLPRTEDRARPGPPDLSSAWDGGPRLVWCRARSFRMRMTRHP